MDGVGNGLNTNKIIRSGRGSNWDDGGGGQSQGSKDQIWKRGALKQGQKIWVWRGVLVSKIKTNRSRWCTNETVHVLVRAYGEESDIEDK